MARLITMVCAGYILKPHWCFVAPFLFFVLSVDEGVAMDKSQGDLAIVLNCPTDVPEPEALCLAMIEALMEAEPQARIRSDADMTALRGNELLLALRVPYVNSYGIGGYLEWWTEQNDNPTRGPDVGFDVVDSDMSRAFYGQFARQLLQSTPSLFTK